MISLKTSVLNNNKYITNILMFILDWLEIIYNIWELGLPSDLMTFTPPSGMLS